VHAVLLQSQYTLRVVVTELAEGTDAEHLGELVGFFGIPLVGLILLVVGLVRRSNARRLPPAYPPPGPYPYGPPPGPPAPPTPPQYYPTPYPAPRPQRSGVALIVVGSLILGFSLLGTLGRATDLASHHLGTVRSAHVGQCVSQSDFQASNMAPTPQDCGVSDALLEVATSGGGSATCPDGKVKDSKYAVLSDKTTTLCFLLNLTQGRCYSATGTPQSPTFAMSPCDGSLPVVQVVRRVDGNSDRTLCPAETKAVSYPQPARLYCLQPIRN
jgi:hypothetical protein